jgi:hypothetical protein
MKNFLFLVGVILLVSSCTTVQHTSYQGGNHIRRGVEHRERPVRNRDVRRIDAAHGKYGGLFHSREIPCSTQW